MISLEDYIVKKYRYLTLEQTISEAIDILIEENLTHIPIIENDIFLGNLSLNDAETFESEQSIEIASALFEPFFARETNSWFEILELFSKNQTNVIPILDTKNKIKGYYLFDDVITFFNETPFLKETGTTIIVEKDIYSYSISQISQIFESNNSKIFGIFISEVNDNIAQITVKSTSININEIIQSLRRYEYKIISEHLEDQFLSDLKDRSDYLDKYLNI